MPDVWETIVETAFELHPDQIRSLASKIRALQTFDDFESVKTDMRLQSDRIRLEELGKAWRASPEVTPSEVATALRAASMTISTMEGRESVEMVWTGPSTTFVASRKTEQVLLEVVSSARSNLFMVSFVAYDVAALTSALQKAIDKHVVVEILLETSSDHGGKVSIDSVRIFKESLPSARIYIWDREDRPEEWSNGAVHAKCAVADAEIAFITSANLTRAAMERNMELGTLARGGDLPKRLYRHLQALVSTGAIVRA